MDIYRENTLSIKLYMCVCVHILTGLNTSKTCVLFQESPSEIGGGGLLSGCWVFLWVVLILFCGLSVCLLLCLFLVAWYFCGYLWCCFVRLCLQGQYCSSYIWANKAAEHFCKDTFSDQRCWQKIRHVILGGDVDLTSPETCLLAARLLAVGGVLWCGVVVFFRSGRNKKSKSLWWALCWHWDSRIPVWSEKLVFAWVSPLLNIDE